MTPSKAQVRQRKDTSRADLSASVETSKSSKVPASELAKAEDASSSIWVDIVRCLVFLVVVSSALSYFITQESVMWGLKRPAFTKLEFMQAYFRRPLHLTDAQLSLYNGDNPGLPIYLAINGSIYDVSSGRRFYGPGGSYSFFAGADGSRAFVTNCFDSDITPDMRGVEEMFLPLEDAEADGQRWSRAELKILRERERREARKSVEKALKHWVDFFEGGKYPRVGKVKREPGWKSKGDAPDLCEKARKGRKKRSELQEEARA